MIVTYFVGFCTYYFIKRVQYCFNVKLFNKLTSKYFISWDVRRIPMKKYGRKILDDLSWFLTIFRLSNRPSQDVDVLAVLDFQTSCSCPETPGFSSRWLLTKQYKHENHGRKLGPVRRGWRRSRRPEELCYRIRLRTQNSKVNNLEITKFYFIRYFLKTKIHPTDLSAIESILNVSCQQFKISYRVVRISTWK